MTTKLVNGERIEMTPEEEAEFEASRKPRPKKPVRIPEHEVLLAALKAKGHLKDSDISAAETKLRTPK